MPNIKGERAIRRLPLGNAAWLILPLLVSVRCGTGGGDGSGAGGESGSGASGGEAAGAESGSTGGSSPDTGGAGGEDAVGGQAAGPGESGGAGGTDPGTPNGGAGGAGGSGGTAPAQGGTAGVPAVPNTEGSKKVYLETGGTVAVEGEHYFEQANKGKRAWYFTSTLVEPGILPDPDKSHAKIKASGLAYMEVLPDTRVTAEDSLSNGFFGSGGDGPTLRYKVRFATTGKYYVWVRALSTGTEDNGVHVGIDGNWPSSGNNHQGCLGKGTFSWSSNKRDSGDSGAGVACGMPNTIYLNVNSTGEHIIEFSMREDGFEMDKWVMTKDANMVFERDSYGPPENPAP